MEIGGFFPYEETSGAETNYAIRMCPSAGYSFFIKNI